MFEFLRQLSDNQTALLGCGVALLGSFGLLSLSHRVNPENRQAAEPVLRGVRDEQPAETRKKAA